MDLTFTDAETAFQQELRAWFESHDPGPQPERHDEAAHYKWRADWQRQLADDGWAAPHWPSEYGGRNASLTQSAIFFEELGRSRSPLPANVLGILLAGPTIMAWGTDEQKERYLQPILTAEEIWCQGFSEPEAGSDLASLKSYARKDGDEWVVNGQKVWTSGAQFSKWCMLVARTDRDVAKHKGLTYFILDMEQPGVQIRPLTQITGEAEFNELFLEDARIPDANVLGGVGNGKIDDPLVADKLADLHVRAEILRLTAYRGLTTVEKYGQPGPEGSLVKWLWSQSNQELTQLSVDILGPAALERSNAWAYELLRARGNTIEGGTTEILKNIIAERVLGLPKAR